MNQDKVLKIIKGLNRFSPDDIAIMAGLEDYKTNSLLDKFLSDGVITKLSDLEYMYVNKIPERRGVFRLIEKPKIKAIPDKNINFQQAAEYFLMNYVLQNCTPSTFKTYNSSIKSHLTPFFGKMGINDITHQDIKKFIELKLIEKISDKNIRNCVTLFGTMFNKFIEWGMVTSSPYNGIINVNKPKKQKIRVLNESEIEFMFKTAQNQSPILYRFILITLDTGLKRAEIFALKKEDIDFKNRKISIDKTLYMGKVIMSRVKTTIRQVDIPEDIIPELKQAVKNKQKDDFIFYDTKLSFYTQDKRLRAIFASIAKQLNLEKFAFDELRHTYAYNALKQGLSIDYIHKQLGYYSIQATMDKYRQFIA